MTEGQKPSAEHILRKFKEALAWPPVYVSIHVPELTKKFRIISKERSHYERHQQALAILRDIVADITVKSVVDDPDEPELPEHKILTLPFGGLGISVHKQSYADFLVKNFAAIEVVPPPLAERELQK